MLRVLTQFRMFEFDKKDVETTFDRSVPFDLVTLHHIYAVELAALLRGDVVSMGLVASIYFALYGEPSTRTYTTTYTEVRCSDGPCLLPYERATLARHFRTIALYECPAFKAGGVLLREVVAAVMSTTQYAVSYERTELLALLQPVSKLYYTLFDLAAASSAFILDVTVCMTEDERATLLSLYEHNRRTSLLCSMNEPLERREHTVLITHAIPGVYRWMMYRTMDSLKTNSPSFYFLLLAAKREHALLAEAVDLTFDDCCGKTAAAYYLEQVKDTLIALLMFVRQASLGRLLAMLNVHHNEFENEKMVVNAPYGLPMVLSASEKKQVVYNLRLRVGCSPLVLGEDAHTIFY